MKGVILAAGKGLRMKGRFGEKPKCLISILGLSLLERILHACKECGIDEVIIVIGDRGDLIKEKMSELNFSGLSIKFVENEEWEKGNKSSLKAALNFIERDEYFLLVMSDHIYETALFNEAVDKLKKKELSIFCFQSSGENNLKEASRVKAIDKKLLAVGKDVDSNLIDCGMMILKGDIIDVCIKGLTEGELSEAITNYAKERNITIHTFTNYYWQDIDTYQDYYIARKKLLKSLISKKEGIISRKLNRFISLKITGIISNYSIKPNIISIVSFIFGILSALLFVGGEAIWGGIMAQLSSIIDGVDGEVARAKYLTSKYGSYLESILDRYVDAAIILGMSFYSLGSVRYELVLIIAVIALLGSVMSMVTKEKFHTEYGMPYIQSIYDGWIQYLPASRDGRLFVVFLGGLFEQVFIALIVLAILSNFQALYRAMHIVKKIRV